ncbi:MAG TPA: OmpA family protein [Nitrospira sp.]|nr:OmpA family protein [Nitrospira sp.]
MTTHSARIALLSLLCLVFGQVAWADDLETIRFGEPALTFSAGGIFKSFPQDGVVNVTTGDNQTTGDRMQLGQRDTLYLRLNNPGDVAVGDLFTIYKRARKVFHPATREYLGYLVIRLAIVEVKQVDKVLTTVHAVRSYGAVSPGDPVAKFSLPIEEEPAENASPDDVAGMLVELQSDMGMTLVAQRNIVYVDRGRIDGLRAGDTMEVVRVGGNLPPRVLGEIKILATQDKTSSALVTKSTARLFKGDRIRLKAPGLETVAASSPMQSAPTQDLSMAAMAEEPGTRKLTVENASRATKISLSDLMKQLRFESGQATIQPAGYEVLDELIAHLKTAPADQLIRVEGHADNMEIGPSLKSRYPTNWDLSKARASGVLRYLVEKGGIDSARVSSVGYGDTKPLVSNATEAGRQRNRRVDILLFPPDTERYAPEQVMKSASGLGTDKPSAFVPDAPSTVTDSQAEPGSSMKAATDEPVPVSGERDQAPPSFPGDQSVERPAPPH